MATKTKEFRRRITHYDATKMPNVLTLYLECGHQVDATFYLGDNIPETMTCEQCKMDKRNNDE